MKTYPTDKIKNIVLLGHSGSGKTTLAEAMAFEGKVIERRGDVDSKNTISDYSEVEHINERSIYSTILYTEFMESKINVIDTPGADDFCGSLFSAFKVADVGVLLLNALNGFEVGTEIQARYARRHMKPIIVAVNQLDHEKANWDATIDSLRAASAATPVLVQYPLNAGKGFDTIIDVLMMKMYRSTDNNGTREEFDIPAEEMERAAELNKILIEAAAENDEALMELYFDKGTLTQDEMREGLKIGLSTRGIVPVFCLSAKNNMGVKRLLEFIKNVAPGPIKAPKFDLKNGESVDADSSKPTSVFVFKTALEPHIGEICYFRVISGTVKEGQELTNQTTGNKEKFAQIFVAAGRNRIRVNELEAGDIGCTVRLRNTRINHTLNDSSIDWQIVPIEFPPPRYRCAVKATNNADEEKLNEQLNRAAVDDPTIIVGYSKEVRQTIIQGQGEQHLNILKWTISNINKLELEYYKPRISYRETITKISTAMHRHRKQSGGAGQFGEVHMLIEPYSEGMAAPGKYKVDGRETSYNVRGTEEIELDWGGKLVFCNAIVGGAIDTRFLPAILKGIMERMEQGPLTGSRARDIRVIVYDGKMHPVDSNELSFMIAGRTAFRDAFRTAGPKIMEPVYRIEILVPSDSMGDVMSDLQNRRAIIEGMSSDKGFELLKARAPLAELYRYSTALSSLSSGRATFTMEFASYEQVPGEVQDKLLQEYAAQEEEDD